MPPATPAAAAPAKPTIAQETPGYYSVGAMSVRLQE
jgi:hypothetical protein